MKRIFLAAILIIVTAVNLSSQSKKPKSTLEIFDENISAVLEEIYLSHGIKKTKSFLFYLPKTSGNQQEAQIRKFFVSLIRKTADKNSLKYSITDNSGEFGEDTSCNKIYLSSSVFKTSFPKFIKRKFLGEKTLQRVISGSFVLEINSSPVPFSFVATDEIDYDEYESYASEEYSFTQAAPPELSTFESVIFPVLLVGVSAAATVLFFIIRTK